MPTTMRIRAANWVLRSVSLVTLAALVVAPTCAPLCSAQNCESSHTQVAATGHCHRVAAPNESPRMRASRGCGSPELPAIVLTRTPLQQIADLERLNALGGNFVAGEHANLTAEARFSENHFGPPHGFAAGFAPLSPTVLRI